MKTYEELLQEYRKRQHDTVVDTIATGLTYVDEIAVDTGLLEETGILTELTQNVTGFLPFVIISATEGTKVLLGKKPGKTGLKDGAFRMVKSGAAMGVGAAVIGLHSTYQPTVARRTQGPPQMARGLQRYHHTSWTAKPCRSDGHTWNDELVPCRRRHRPHQHADARLVDGPSSPLRASRTPSKH